MKTALLSPFKLFYFLLSCSILINLTACGSKKYQKEIKTPEMIVHIVAHKPTSLDPFMVNLILTHAQSQKNVSLDIEVFANDLNDSNPTFSKQSDGKYVLVFKQTDDTARELILSINEEEVLIEEVL